MEEKEYGVNFMKDDDGNSDTEVTNEVEEVKELNEEKKKSPPKKKAAKKRQNRTKSKQVKVVVGRTHVLAGADPFSKYLCGVVRGTRLKLLSEEGDWMQIEVPRANGDNIVGFVRSTKVLKV